MLNGQNSQVSNSLTTLIGRAGAKIADAIQTASAKTGVDFSYLLQQAQVESSFKSDAKASTSTASGLYQFVDSTWLRMVNKYGDKYGLSDLASQISDNGKVSDPAVKKQILALRNDPNICSLMAGELAADNKSYLENCTNCNVGSTELYMAHFLGAAGAAKFLNAMDKNGHVAAATLLPAAAEANKNIFYTAQGKPRSLNEVYNLLDKKFSITSTSCAVTPATNQAKAVTTISNSTKPESNNMDVIMSQTSTNNAARLAQIRQSRTNTYDPTKNYGGIPGLQSPVILPVDILALLKTEDHNNNKRYNA